MAEAVFRHLVHDRGLEKEIQVDSAGTGNWHVGKPPHQGTQQILNDHQISFEGIKARQIAKADSQSFDYIIAMDQKNKCDLDELFQNQAREITILPFMSFLKEHPYDEVPDPYFTGNFDEVYDIVSQGSVNLLNFICEKEKIKR